MELMLIVVSLVSLAIATAMSVVAWKLARDSRQRSDARVEALEELALGDLSDLSDEASGLVPVLAAVPAVAPAPPRPVRTMLKPPVQVPMRFTTLDDSKRASDAPDWDAPIENESSDALFATAQPAAPRGRWLALVAVAGLMALGAGTIYVLHTPGALSITGSAASATDRQAAMITRPLELVSLRYSTDEPGTFVVSGLVHNPVGAKSLRGVVAVVYLFDAQGQYAGNGRIAIDAAALDPGVDSTFMIRVPTTGTVARYRVGFRFPDGTVVAHIDKRPDPAAGHSGAPPSEQRAAEGS